MIYAITVLLIMRCTGNKLLLVSLYRSEVELIRMVNILNFFWILNKRKYYLVK